MSPKTRGSLARVALTCLAVVPGAFVLASGRQDAPPMELPPGWTQKDMEACMLAGQPGEMHEHLNRMVGVWKGTHEMWMGPEMESMTTDTTWTMESILGGRYVKCTVESEMPGMGPFEGQGVAGYDNVSQEYVGDWIDSMSTGIMRGTGKASDGGKTFSWEYTYNDAVTRKSAVFREVLRLTSDTTMSVEMFMTDPKSGKEFKAMQVELQKRS